MTDAPIPVPDSPDSFPSRDTIEAALADVPTEQEQDLAVLPEHERAVGAKLLPGLVAKISERCEAQKAKKLSDEIGEIRRQNQKMMEQEIANWRAKQVPPTSEELEKLLSQEYGEITISLPLESGKRSFTIRELPQTAEKKLMLVLQKGLLPHLKELQSVEFTSSTTVAAKIQRIMDVIPDALDMLADMCAIALDHKGKEITREWIQDNLSSFRITQIVEAQIAVGKIRDFISAASRLIPQ